MVVADADYVIFLPVRNGGSYLRTAIDSIVAQTLPNWRLIVLENASSDDTVATVQSYRDDRITLMPSDRPLSIEENWRRGYQLLQSGAVNGGFVTFIGHDDLYRPDFLREIDSLVAREPDASLYQTEFELIDKDGRTIRPCRPVPESETAEGLAAALCWGIRDSFGTGYVFRPADYVRAGGIPDLPLLLFADHLLFIRLTALGRKACAPAQQFAYRLHRGSTSGGMSAPRINAHIEALARFIDTLGQEQAHFTSAAHGRAALSCLIAREALLYDAPLIRRALDHQNLGRLAGLRSAYDALSDGVDKRSWLGSNPITTRLYPMVRKAVVAAKLFRGRAG
jgi:glycosyltransferase involved in cell wall biosynthesis